MAEPEQLEYLQDTADDWNLYRREHAIMHPHLSGADLSAAQLPGVDLSGADLTRADLRAIDLTGSNLANADLNEANLSGAFLLNAVLTGANMNLLGLTASGKGRGSHSQHNELFEMVSGGISAAGLPFRYGTPGDMQLGGQSGLCQADMHPQRQHRSAEGIVALIISGSLHGRSPFRITLQIKAM